MSNPRVKSASLFYKGKRIATMQGVQYTIKPGGTQEVADSGAYNTDGVVLTEVSCDTIQPITGTGVSIVEDAINQNDVALTLGIVDGKLHELSDARCNECSFQSEVATGKMTGKFSWHAGKPKITG